MVYDSSSEKETQKIAADLAKNTEHNGPRSQATVIAFEGELGAGKTTFIKAFAKAFGVREKITSPTFVLMCHYPIPSVNDGFKLLIHIDAYRLKNHSELIPLGIEEITANPKNIVLIEWSDRVREILPSACIKIHMDHVAKNERKIEIING